MLLLTRFTEDQRRLMLLDCSLAPYIHFHFAYGFNTRKLAYVIDSLVRVTRRL